MQSQATISLGFGIEKHYGFSLGMSVQQIADKLFGGAQGVAALIRCPDGSPQLWEPIPIELWPFSKPKGKNVIKFVTAPRGGDGNIFATIAAIIVSIAAPYLAGTVLGLTGVSLAATTAAITIGAGAIVSSLFAPAQNNQPAQNQEDSAQNSIANVEADQNLLTRGGRLPRILGSVRRVSPPSVVIPHRYLENGREVIETVYGLDGHHKLSDLEIDGVSIENIKSVVYEVQDGKESSPSQSLVKRITKPVNIGSSLSGFSIRTDTDELTEQTNPIDSEPSSISFATIGHESLEQITLRLRFAPFVDRSNPENKVRYPIRILMRPKNSPETEFRLPEIHVIGETLFPVLKEIKIRWDDDFGRASASKDFLYQFWDRVPATSRVLSDLSTGDQWQSEQAQINGNVDGINIQVSESIIPKGEYEFEVTAGLAVKNEDFNTVDYSLNGEVESLFKSYRDGNFIIPSDQQTVSAGASLEFATVIAKERPVQTPKVAQVSVKIKDQDLKNLTLKSAAFVKDWDGDGWNNLTTSSNPATQAYNVLFEWLTFFRVNTDLINSQAFVDWRQECIHQGYECSYPATGQAVTTVIDNLCTAGYATKTIEDGFSIDFFRDRSSEVPEMSFSPRDSKISIKREFSEMPKGIRSKFSDRDNRWRETEAVFNNPYVNSPFEENESIDYPSIDSAEAVRKRAIFDMLQLREREIKWNVSTGVAGFNLKRGSLVNVVTDLNNDDVHGFFVKQIVSDRSFVVDRIVPSKESVSLGLSNDIFDLESVFSQGLVSSAMILEPDGMNEYSVSSVIDDVVTVTTDIPNTWTVGSETYDRSDMVGTRISIGPRDRFFNRCFVYNIERQSEEKSLLTLVDESPQIQTELTRLFG